MQFRNAFSCPCLQMRDKEMLASISLAKSSSIETSRQMLLSILGFYLKFMKNDVSNR